MKHACKLRLGTFAGFTLIELLIVIAIIAILAAILFPVFAQAKIAAKKAAAISNNKQILLGEIMYSGDVDDMFVPYFSGSADSYRTPPQQYWPQLISTYISKGTGHGASGQMIDTDLSGVFFDPIETIKPQIAGVSVGTAVSWGISDDIVDWYGPPLYTPSHVPRNNSAAAAPADTLIFAESYDWQYEAGYPGSALILSYFDKPSSDYPGVPTVGALRTVDAHYRTNFTKSCYALSECKNWYADLGGLNVTGYVDGHTKAVVVGSITTQPDQWSLSGNKQWP